MELKNKVVLVTGGSSGIGQAIVVALASEGCQVIFTYRGNENGAEETLKKTGKYGTALKANFHKEEEVKKIFSTIKKKYGHLDILVNNVGINRPRDLFSTEVWREIFQVNLFSAVLCTEEAVKLMGGKGRILNISSIYAEGKSCWKGLPAFGASKAAMNHFTQTLAKNLAPDILVNAIAPGYVQTPLWKNTTEEDFIESGKEQLIERMILPEEIAQIAVSVIKNDAMTGEIVAVDGGVSLKTV